MDEKINFGFGIFDKLFFQASKVLFVYDVDAASITYLNAAFSHLWNRTRESVIASPAILLETVHPEDREHLFREYHELTEGTPKYGIEFRIRTPDGSILWLLLTPQFFTDATGGRCIAGMVEDITDAKENIDTLHKHGAKKNAILEILSHDLAGPLASIQSLADALSESTKSYENAEANNLIRIIRESSERSLRMIRDFVQQEFLETAEAAMVTRRVNLVKKVREVMEQLEGGERIINREFRFNSSSDRLYVYIDQDKFGQVITNLISNAIKFTRDGGVIAVDISEQETSVLIAVKDNGIGIPERYHDKLFEKFTPARREGLKGEPSTGLGLAIAKTIMEWHKGSIWFESEENVGTTFYIEIPKE
ncbi:PAS domain S-box protein [Pontibacter diazotrophicus]|uniref:histidine kinase n=1 Tax=Pontibacter diazotrophicus TaxID=1400979 RepID=A0A3D8L3K6_9BACT|nr:PAS domain-containing sensor histidine kinase [Pontibacter diazotrophicus]RDV11960.1 PAS domain S-box protein [Pontibacter diazotrophicus]